MRKAGRCDVASRANAREAARKGHVGRTRSERLPGKRCANAGRQSRARVIASVTGGARPAAGCSISMKEVVAVASREKLERARHPSSGSPFKAGDRGRAHARAQFGRNGGATAPPREPSDAGADRAVRARRGGWRCRGDRRKLDRDVTRLTIASPRSSSLRPTPSSPPTARYAQQNSRILWANSPPQPAAPRRPRPLTSTGW